MLITTRSLRGPHARRRFFRKGQTRLVSSEGNHSENEVCLYNELQAAKAELKTQKELILQLQQEKQEIVALMHQAAVSLHYFRDGSSSKT